MLRRLSPIGLVRDTAGIDSELKKLLKQYWKLSDELFPFNNAKEIKKVGRLSGRMSASDSSLPMYDGKYDKKNYKKLLKMLELLAQLEIECRRKEPQAELEILEIETKCKEIIDKLVDANTSIDMLIKQETEASDTETLAQLQVEAEQYREILAQLRIDARRKRYNYTFAISLELQKIYYWLNEHSQKVMNQTTFVDAMLASMDEAIKRHTDKKNDKEQKKLAKLKVLSRALKNLYSPVMLKWVAHALNAIEILQISKDTALSPAYRPLPNQCLSLLDDIDEEKKSISEILKGQSLSSQIKAIHALSFELDSALQSLLPLAIEPTTTKIVNTNENPQRRSTLRANSALNMRGNSRKENLNRTKSTAHLNISNQSSKVDAVKKNILSRPSLFNKFKNNFNNNNRNSSFIYDAPPVLEIKAIEKDIVKKEVVNQFIADEKPKSSMPIENLDHQAQQLIQKAIKILQSPILNDTNQFQNKALKNYMSHLIYYAMDIMQLPISFGAQQDKMQKQKELYSFAQEISKKVDFSTLSLNFLENGTAYEREMLNPNNYFNNKNEENKNNNNSSPYKYTFEELGNGNFKLYKYTRTNCNTGLTVSIAVRASEMTQQALEQQSSREHLQALFATSLPTNQPEFTPIYMVMPGYDGGDFTGTPYRMYEMCQFIEGKDLVNVYKELYAAANNKDRTDQERDHSKLLLQAMLIDVTEQDLVLQVNLSGNECITWTDGKETNLLLELIFGQDLRLVISDTKALLLKPKDSLYLATEGNNLQVSPGYYTDASVSSSAEKTNLNKLLIENILFMLYQLLVNDENYDVRDSRTEVKYKVLTSILPEYAEDLAPHLRKNVEFIFSGDLGVELQKLYRYLLKELIPGIVIDNDKDKVLSFKGILQSFDSVIENFKIKELLRPKGPETVKPSVEPEPEIEPEPDHNRILRMRT